jgi:hypothetical protein
MDGRLSPSDPPALCPNTVLKEYCLEHAAVFRELTEVRKKVSFSD